MTGPIVENPVSVKLGLRDGREFTVTTSRAGMDDLFDRLAVGDNEGWIGTADEEFVRIAAIDTIQNLSDELLMTFRRTGRPGVIT